MLANERAILRVVAGRPARGSGDQPSSVAGPSSTAPARPDSRYSSDPALIQSCLDGDQAAWNELINRYRRLVYSIPQHYGFSPDDADDIFQNVFLTVLRRLQSLRDQTRLSSWLITITHRACYQAGRTTCTDAELKATLPDKGVPLVELVEQWEQQQVIRQALSQLDPRCRQLLTALFLDSDSPHYREVAERFGIAPGSIGPTRSRCCKKLEAILIGMGLGAPT